MKKKDKAKEPSEILSLNDELLSFDVDDMNVEELERRLELAVAAIVPIDDDGCGTNCGTNCGVNCGVNG